jgi:hypothetical protein
VPVAWAGEVETLPQRGGELILLPGHTPSATHVRGLTRNGSASTAMPCGEVRAGRLALMWLGFLAAAAGTVTIALLPNGANRVVGAVLGSVPRSSMSAPSSAETWAPGVEERGGGAGGLRAGIAASGVRQGDGLVPGQARGGRGVVVDRRPVQEGQRAGPDVAAVQASGVERAAWR